MSDAVRKHAKYGPSRFERLFLCPGSVRMEAQAPERPSSPHAARGTDAHTLLECALKNNCFDAREAWFEHSPFFMSDVDTELCAGVQQCLEYVEHLLQAYPGAQVFVEQRFEIPTVNAPGECFGFNDIGVYVPSINWLWVIDYKNGTGVVEVEECKQLLGYGVGAVYGGSITEPVVGVTLAIVQPNAFHPQGAIREWHTTPDALLDFAVKLDDQIAVAESPDAPLVPGEEQCRYCNAATTCPAIEAQALQVAGSNFASVKEVTLARLQPPAEMPVDRLGYVLAAADVLRNWLRACEEQATELAKKGYNIPGRKLVEALGRRDWHVEASVREEYEALGLDPLQHVAEKLVDLTGCSLDEVFPRKLITLTEAEKLVTEAASVRAPRGKKKAAAEAAKQAFAWLTLKEGSGKLTLVSTADRRPAVSVATAHFNSVQIPDMTGKDST